MAMTQEKQRFVIRLANIMKHFEQDYGEMKSLIALFYGQTTNYNTNISNTELAEVTAFDGITETTLDEAMFIISGLVERYDERIEHVSNLTQRG